MIVNFGDSIFGNVYDENEMSIAKYLKSITGMTVINAAFGGSRMSSHRDCWDAFSMYRIADSITSGDFSLQLNANYPANEWVPDYCRTRAAALSRVNFDKVEIITIAFGANDYTSAKKIDDPQNPYNFQTYLGAARYSVEKILKRFPHIRVFICSPTFFYWEKDGEYSDGETKYFNEDKNTILDFVGAAKAVAHEYKLPFADLYHEAGINKYNAHYFFKAPDTVHHIETGRQRIAETLGRHLLVYKCS